jgi:hypothetical protein
MASDLLRMTISGPRLRTVALDTAGQRLHYGLGMVSQISPTQIAVQVNRRPCGVPVVDLEDGCDLFVVDAPEALASAAPMALLRNEPARHPATGEDLIMVKYPAAGGFIPWGARKPDGTPHPHAGTGFALSIALGYPADHSETRPESRKDQYLRFELQQHRFDGVRFEIVSREPVACDELLAGWYVHRQALGNAIPSGDDLLFCHVAREPGQRRRTGVSRWSRGPNGWRPGPFTPVTPPDDSFEPSILRDLDGSLLVCVRTGQWENNHHFQVFRSTDEGKTWSAAIDDPWMRCASPVSILATRDGRPFLAANPYRREHVDNLGRQGYSSWMREDLEFFPLTDDRRHVRIPTHVFDARALFGPVRQDPGRHINFWYVDHPLGGVFRLGDGRWHALVGFRVCDLWEICTDALPTEPAGYWLEEVLSEGQDRPPWRF